MFKKIKKTLGKEFKKRYEQMESNYLGLENRIYSTIELRLATLEEKFEELSDLLKTEIRARKERNEDKMEEIAAEDNDTALSETIEEVKDVITTSIKDAKKNVNKKVEEVSEKVKKAKDAVSGTIKKATNKKNKEEVSTGKKAAKVETTEINQAKDDLTKIKGLGAKTAEKLMEEGIASFAQLANLSQADMDKLDQKIKNFSATCTRFDFKGQAEKM